MKRLAALAALGALAARRLRRRRRPRRPTPPHPPSTAAAHRRTDAPAAGGDRRRVRRRQDPGRRRTDHRHRRPGVPALRHRRRARVGRGLRGRSGAGRRRADGLHGDAVTWIRTGFDAAIAPGEKDFDFNLQQFSINPEREEIVSFSTPYYTANQAVLGYADGPAASVTKLSDLKTLKLGAAAGDHQPAVHHRGHPARRSSRSRSTATPTPRPRSTTSRSMRSSPTCPPACTSAPSRSRAPRCSVSSRSMPAAPATRGACCSRKDNPLVECANLALAALDRQRRARRHPGSVDGRVHRGTHARPRTDPSRLQADRTLPHMTDQSPGRRPRVGALARRRRPDATAALPARGSAGDR